MKREPIEAIEFRRLSFAYEEGQEVFQDLSFNFSEHPILYLQSPTGGGKSTVMKLLAGLVAPTAGEYLINGRAMQNCSFSEFDPYRLSMGYCFDVGGLINNQTLYENFRLPLDFHDVLPEQEKRDFILRRLEVFKLQDLKHLRPAFVSAGARKGAAILRSFLLNPTMVILNDPTLGLGSDMLGPLVSLIREHQELHGLKYVVLASEDVKLMQRLPGKVVHVKKNQLEYV